MLLLDFLDVHHTEGSMKAETSTASTRTRKAKNAGTKTTSRKRGTKSDAAETHVTARPSMGDPDREQDLPIDRELPDLDNETVHKTARPVSPHILEDDDLEDEVAQEHQTDRDEDVSEGNPL